jgi:SAM-dependent methyltransferase
MSAPLTDSFDAKLFPALFESEKRHFWFRARTRVIQELARQATHELPAGYRVLEIGCGTGNVLRALEEACATGEVTGIEPFEEAVTLARSRVKRSTVIQGDVFTMDLPGKFDLIGIFDVLEHLQDDEGAMRRIRSLLRPGGKLLVTVPAHQYLWSYFDRVSHHCRRYERGELCAKLVAAGFTIDFASELFSLLLPLAWLARRTGSAADPELTPEEAAKLSERELRRVPVVNEILLGLFRGEEALVKRRISIPLGTSLLAVASAAA